VSGLSGSGPEVDGPVLDEDGLLRHAGRWVAIPDTQLDVVALLVANRDRIVATELVVEAHAHAGGSTTPSALEALLGRLRARLAEVGLSLHTIRQRGVLLEVHPAC
jgi:DNA-binding response OmpR family regulator